MTLSIFVNLLTESRPIVLVLTSSGVTPLPRKQLLEHFRPLLALWTSNLSRSRGQQCAGRCPSSGRHEGVAIDLPNQALGMRH